jgi:hypothetical protein
MDSSDNTAEFNSFNNLIRIDELTATNSSISFDTAVSRKKNNIFSVQTEKPFLFQESIKQAFTENNKFLNSLCNYFYFKIEFDA